MQISVRHKGTVIVTFVGYDNGHLMTLLPYDTCNNDSYITIVFKTKTHTEWVRVYFLVKKIEIRVRTDMKG